MTACAPRIIISTVGCAQHSTSPGLYRLPPLDWTRRAHPTRSRLLFSLHCIHMTARGSFVLSSGTFLFFPYWLLHPPRMIT